jgi:UDP-3-O-[3-hydroxymyristoyl] glucosamine N-acyltransferase
MEFTAQQIADFLNGSVEGDPTAKVNNFSKIEEGCPGSLTFLANPKYEHFIYKTKASIVLVNEDFMPDSDIKATLIRVPNAYASLAMLLNMAEQSKTRKNGIDSSAFIAQDAVIGEGCYVGAFAYIGEKTEIGKGCMIYPYAYIGDRVKIGENTMIYPHATLYDGCIVGKNCMIHAGAVIGADGFGFAPENGVYKKIPQLGNVILEDEVEIGANTTIDRAVMGSTLIHKGVKLDNLIQVAHNVEIGENTVMAAQVGIAGSTKVGSNCMLGGQVGLGGHITIGDNSQIGAQSGIISHVNENSKIMGYLAIPIKDFMRSNILLKKLPEIYQSLNQLKKEVEELRKNKS